MEWISVKERLPEAGIYVLVCCTMKVTDKIRYERAIVMAFVCEDGFISERHEISHWAELPKPPKEEHHE